MLAKTSEPVFTVSLQKGLADRHRLPLDQMIAVLSEVRQMIIETGREIQRERGVDEEKPLDFGLEILADRDGKTFKAGSLRARIAITNNVEIGAEAAQRVIETVYALGSPKKPVMKVLSSEEQAATAKIINRLDRIAFVHERSKAQAKFTMAVPKGLAQEVKPRRTATFGSVAVKNLSALREPVFSEDNVTIYGRLVELKDKTLIEREKGKFWGELRRDNGERWRVQFRGDDESRAVPLFRRQVCVTGDAFYFQTRNPKLIASEVVEDKPRRYTTAFDEIFGINKALYNADLQTLLSRRYGED